MKSLRASAIASRCLVVRIVCMFIGVVLPSDQVMHIATNGVVTVTRADRPHGRPATRATPRRRALSSPDRLLPS